MSKNNKPTFDPEVKFIHLRYRDGAGNILSSGGSTFAYRAVEGGIQYAHSRCHPNDNYVKSLGRIKAHGRLASKNARVFAGVEQDFLNTLEGQAEGWNLAERFAVTQMGYDPSEAVQMFRKFNGKRKRAVVLTEGDAQADLNGTPRPDNPTV